MSKIIHKRQITEEESEGTGYVISQEEWNEGHIIEMGSARIFVGLDSAKGAVAAVMGNLYFATDTKLVYAYMDDWVELPLKGPDYDSGWGTIAQGEVIKKIHGLGGAASNYLISLLSRKTIPETEEFDYPFTVPSNYSYDPLKVQVAAGVAKLLGVGFEAYAHYHLNESSGSIAADSSGNGRHGTLINMEDEDWVLGKLDNGLEFDGVNELVDCGDIASFEYDEPFSLEAWFKTLESTRGRYIISKHNRAIGRGYNVYVSKIGEIRVVIASNVGANLYLYVYTTAQGYNDGNLHHVVVTYDGSHLASGCHIYVDGENKSLSVGKNSLGMNTIINTVNFQISGVNAEYSQGYPDFWKGLIDEVVIYEQELTQEDVDFRWNNGNGIESLSTFPTDNPTIEPSSLEIFESLSAFYETAIKPAGTEIKYIISDDDGATWHYWTGAAWAVSDESYGQSSLASDIHSNISSFPSSGYQFKFKAFLHTSDVAKTPELDRLQVTNSIQPYGINNRGGVSFMRLTNAEVSIERDISDVDSPEYKILIWRTI